MKISKLIEQLERAKELHGDVEVYSFENSEIHSEQCKVNRIVKLNDKVSVLPEPKKPITGKPLHNIFCLKDKWAYVTIEEMYNTEIIFAVKKGLHTFYYWMDLDGNGDLFPAWKDKEGFWRSEAE